MKITVLPKDQMFLDQMVIPGFVKTIEEDGHLKAERKASEGTNSADTLISNF